MHDLPCFLDFEASSLDISSYPIQVAWSMPGGTIESYFINPNSVEYWVDWDDYAEEAIHQISRETLSREGLTPVQVAEAMNAALEGKTLYCDGGEWDQMWLDELFRVAELNPLFVLGDFRLMIYSKAEQIFGGLRDYDREELWEEIESQVRMEINGRQHLADNDVRYLQRFYESVMTRQTAVNP